MLENTDFNIILNDKTSFILENRSTDKFVLKSEFSIIKKNEEKIIPNMSKMH